MTTDLRFTARPSAGDRDVLRIYELAGAAQAYALHVADLPWRLASPSPVVPERTCLWEDANGNLVAWAVLQFSWLCLDFEIHPDARSSGLESNILAWACARLQGESTGREKSLSFYVSARERDSARIAAIERARFTRDSWSYVHMIRDLGQSIPEPTTPPGFIVRPLAGECEIDAYVAMHRAAFGSANMTADWRRATLRDRRYLPDLDLVAVAPDGTLVGFCVCWITPPLAGRRVAQVEPLGILPAYRRRGLGRALLLEGLRRAKEHGADRVEVDAESYNETSRKTYEAVGFRPAYEAPFFRRTFG